MNTEYTYKWHGLDLVVGIDANGRASAILFPKSEHLVPYEFKPVGLFRTLEVAEKAAKNELTSEAAKRKRELMAQAKPENVFFVPGRYLSYSNR